MREFQTGATRDSDESKPDYEGFLSPVVLKSYGEYMQKHRVQADGKLRDSDNWQKGIPKEQYMKSAWRHFLEWWEGHRDGTDTTEPLNALLFNVMGYQHETLKHDPPPAKTSPCPNCNGRGGWDSGVLGEKWVSCWRCRGTKIVP